MLEMLSNKGLAADDYPIRDGIPVDSAEALERTLAAEAPLAKQSQDAQEAKFAERQAAEADAAAIERANEASADTFAEVDLTFASCFISSEEDRFDMRPKVVGQSMWTSELEQLRTKSFREFLQQLVFDDASLEAALSKLAMADVLRKAFEFEEREAKRGEADTPKALVTDRARQAWANRAMFIEEWKDRKQVRYAPSKPSYEGMSAVGRLRAQRAYERELSGEASDETADKVNKWFNDFMDRM